MDDLEIGAGGGLHPILERERVQAVFRSFSACALPHSDREPLRPNTFRLTLRDIFARMWYWMMTLILCRGGVTMLTKLSTQKHALFNGRALYRLSIVFLITALLGCGTRSGGYSEFGPSFEHTSSSEEWSIYNQDHNLLESGATDDSSFEPAGYVKLGLGLGEQAIVHTILKNGNPSSIGGGLTIFFKKTAPSAFFDVSINSLGLQTNIPTSYNFRRDIRGGGVTVGAGYEFSGRLSRFALKLDLTKGGYVLDQSNADIVDVLTSFFSLFTEKPDYEYIEGNADSFTVSLKGIVLLY